MVGPVQYQGSAQAAVKAANLDYLEFRTVPNALQGIPALVLLLAATILAVSERPQEPATAAARDVSFEIRALCPETMPQSPASTL
jgi:hypothetical protein